MLFWILLPIHVLACLFLILVVLLQSGKAGDIASAFGGSGSQAAFGPRGSGNVLTKTTAAAAAIFMLTSLGLVLVGIGDGGSVIDEIEDTATPAPITAPVTPPPATTETTPAEVPPAEGAPATENAPADVAPEGQ